MLLRSSKHGGNANWDAVREWAEPAMGRDAAGYRREFVELIELARQIDDRQLSLAR